jgi:hypothetical protein
MRSLGDAPSQLERRRLLHVLTAGHRMPTCPPAARQAHFVVGRDFFPPGRGGGSPSATCRRPQRVARLRPASRASRRRWRRVARSASRDHRSQQQQIVQIRGHSRPRRPIDLLAVFDDEATASRSAAARSGVSRAGRSTMVASSIRVAGEQGASGANLGPPAEAPGGCGAGLQARSSRGPTPANAEWMRSSAPKVARAVLALGAPNVGQRSGVGGEPGLVNRSDRSPDAAQQVPRFSRIE